MKNLMKKYGITSPFAGPSKEYLQYKKSCAAAEKIIAQVKAIEVAGCERRMREITEREAKRVAKFDR